MHKCSFSTRDCHICICICIILCTRITVAPIDTYITILCRYQLYIAHTKIPQKVIGTPGLIHEYMYFHVLRYKTLFKYPRAHFGTQYMLKLCPLVKMKCVLVSTDHTPTRLTVWEFCRLRKSSSCCMHLKPFFPNQSFITLCGPL